MDISTLNTEELLERADILYSFNMLFSDYEQTLRDYGNGHVQLPAQHGVQHGPLRQHGGILSVPQQGNAPGQAVSHLPENREQYLPAGAGSAGIYAGF